MHKLHRSHRTFRKAMAVVGALALVVALAGSLSGCAAQDEDELPATHLDQAGLVAASHGRCGACHEGATRGDGTYMELDYTGMADLPLSEFQIVIVPDEPYVPESLYVETMPEGGAQ